MDSLNACIRNYVLDVLGLIFSLVYILTMYFGNFCVFGLPWLEFNDSLAHSLEVRIWRHLVITMSIFNFLAFGLLERTTF